MSDTQVLLGEEQSVKVGEQVYVVKDFKLGKTLRMLEYVSQLLETTSVNSFFSAANKGEQALIVELAEQFPTFMRTARPVVFSAMALTLIPDSRLAEIDEKDESYEAEIAKITRVIKAELDAEAGIQILALAIKGMGIDKIRKNFPTLLQSLKSL